MNTFNNHHISLITLLIMVLVSCGKTEKMPDSAGTDIYVEDTGFKVVGYLAARGFDQIDEFELDNLTHLNLAFGNPDQNGQLVFSGNADIKPIVNKGHAADLKVYVSIAGGGNPDTVRWNSWLQPENMPVFINSILDYVEENNLDGVDVDIEWNLLPYINNRYTSFVLQLRDALHARGKGITTALGATNLHESVTQESLEAYDFINVMVYDKTGPWRPDSIGPHAPYSYAEDAVRYWTEERKISAKKIILGVPFYGHNFATPAHSQGYSKIIEGNVEYAYRDSLDLMYYDGIPMIVRKTELAKEKLGGVMIWELTLDTLNSELSLLRTINQTLKAGDCVVKTYYKDADGDGLGDPSYPLQACELPEGYVENRDDSE